MMSPSHPPPKGVYIQLDGEEEKYISIPELEKLCKFTYTEVYVVDSAVETKLKPVKATDAQAKKYEELLKALQDNPDFFTSKIQFRFNSRMGWYIVAREDLPPRQIVGRYTGSLDFIPKEKKAEEALGLQTDYGRKIPISHKDYEDPIMGITDAKKFGNFTRFFGHHPWANELFYLNLNVSDFPLGVTPDRVAVDNLENITLIEDGKIYGYFLTCTFIPRGCPIGFSYFPGFWEFRGKHFLLLDVQGGDPLMLAHYECISHDYRVVKSKELIERPLVKGSTGLIVQTLKHKQPTKLAPDVERKLFKMVDDLKSADVFDDDILEYIVKYSLNQEKLPHLLGHLKKAGILSPTNRKLLIESIHSANSYFIDKIESAFEIAAKTGFLAEYFHLLINVKAPLFLINGIINLKKAGILNPSNIDALRQMASQHRDEDMHSLDRGLYYLTAEEKKPLLTQDLFSFLLKHPQTANPIGSCFAMLNHRKILKPEYRQWIFENISHLDEIANILSALFNASNGDYQKADSGDLVNEANFKLLMANINFIDKIYKQYFQIVLLGGQKLDQATFNKMLENIAKAGTYCKEQPSTLPSA